MLEYWKDGILGKLESAFVLERVLNWRVRGHTPLDDRIKTEFLPLKTQNSIMPPFHYSMVEFRP
jgi:hypothetical protein